MPFRGYVDCSNIGNIDGENVVRWVELDIGERMDRLSWRALRELPGDGPVRGRIFRRIRAVVERGNLLLHQHDTTRMQSTIMEDSRSDKGHHWWSAQ